MENVRKFALVVVDDFDKEVDRFNLDYAENPKNLGFEMEYTTLESWLTTIFLSAKEKKLPTTLNINFLPPLAYSKANAFRAFCQRHMSDRVVLEYDDTLSVKSWEGKIQKFEQTEQEEWGGLVCPVSFLPSSPKYIRRDNVIRIQYSGYGKSYPFKYPYSYGKSISTNNTIENDYFDDIPLRVILHGEMSNPTIRLTDLAGATYSQVRFDGIQIAEGEHLVVDAIRSKVMLYRGGSYQSAYDYVVKDSGLDTFLFAKKNSTSLLEVALNPSENGWVQASYRQYVL